MSGVSGALPGARADDCTAKCAALMTEFRTTIPADRVTAVEQSPVWLRNSLQVFCKVPPSPHFAASTPHRRDAKWRLTVND